MAFVSGVLSNGISVGIDPNPHSHGVSVRLVIRNGSRHDGVSGSTHFLEHCMSQARTASGNVADDLERLCVSSGFYTSKERVLIEADCVAEDFQDVLQLISTAVLDPAFDDESFEREQSRILHEELESRTNFPLLAPLQKRLYGSHLFANTILGLRSDIEAMTPGALRDHHRANVVGERIGIVVSGPVDPAQVMVQLEALLRNLPRGTAAPATTQPICNSVHLSHHKVQDTQELSFYVQDTEAAPDDRMACIAFTELLKKELDRQLCARALNYSGSYAAYVPYSDFGFYEICITAPPANAPDISRLISSTLDDPERWLTSANLDGLKRRWKLQDAFQVSDPRQRVRLMATEYELTGKIIDWHTIDAGYADLSLEHVREAAHRFDIDNAARLSIGPVAQANSAAPETQLSQQFDLV